MRLYQPRILRISGVKQGTKFKKGET